MLAVSLDYRTAIDAALANLNAKHKAIIDASYFEDRPSKDVGDEFGETVRQRGPDQEAVSHSSCTRSWSLGECGKREPAVDDLYSAATSRSIETSAMRDARPYLDELTGVERAELSLRIDSFLQQALVAGIHRRRHSLDSARIRHARPWSSAC